MYIKKNKKNKQTKNTPNKNTRLADKQDTDIICCLQIDGLQ